MKNNIIKLKKYIFLISLIFFISSLSHLIYLYLYNDSKLIAIKGGKISEGLIGDIPSLNPLKPLTGNNNYIINLLYRSILRYDINEKKIVGDIARCDISNLLYIECYLDDNIKWSNGEKITTEDVISTYKILKNTNINPIISSLLSETEISVKDNNIVSFKNNVADINFLNVFFQPILPKSVIDSLGEDKLKGEFTPNNGIYSGKYILGDVTSDETLGIKSFNLEKNNNYYNNPILIDKFVLKLFSDTSSLLKNKDTINIFNDKNNLIGESIPRFENKKYTQPQYISLFLNKDKIQDVDLRTFILKQINNENLIKILGENNYKIVNNPFLTDKLLTKELNNKNFESILSKLGYYKKAHFTNPGSQITTGTGEINENITINDITGELDINNYQKDSEYIISPTYVDKYNFITKDDITLKGVAIENTKEVYINDYKLTDFKENDKNFYYTLNTKYSTIKEGENNYKIFFVINGEKKLAEEVNFMYYKDKSKLESEQINYVKKLELEKRKKEIEDKKKFALENKEKLEKEKISNEEKMKKINELDEKLFYNDKFELLTFTLVYIDGDLEISKTATYIENTLKEIGINVKTVPINIEQIQNYILEKNYDMILTGINLGYFSYNLFPYLHSSQAKNGYNFSNIRKTSLDILLEELKSSLLSEDKIIETQNKIIEILQNEQIVNTLYTPKINLLIDKNIKNINIPEYLPSQGLRIYIFDKAYINDKKIINFENKTFINFFKYIFKKLNE